MNALMGIVNHPLGRQLGWALWHSVWEGAVVAGIFAIARLALRRRSAEVRYFGACAAMIVLFVAPVISLIRAPTKTTPNERTETRVGQLIAESTAGGDAVTVAQLPSGTGQLLKRGAQLVDEALPTIVMVWVAGVMALSCRWLQGCWWIRNVRTTDTASLDEEWLARLEELKRRLKVSRPVCLLESALVEVPMVVGWLRPVILLPACTLAGLTPVQLEAILAHELAHVRRHDFLVNSFQILVETLLFYHPAVWWISRCIREEREHCCDNLVVRVCGDRMKYARALVNLEEMRGVPSMAFAANGGSLSHRIRRLLVISWEDRPSSPAEFGAMALIAIGCILIVAAVCVFGSSSNYQARALLKVIGEAGINELVNRSASYGPYLVQTECTLILSPAVLKQAVQTLGLSQTWARQYNSGARLTDSELSKLLRARLNPQPILNTFLIELQASDADPSEAARLANGVAVAYQRSRQEQRRRAVQESINNMEAGLAEQNEKIRNAQSEVDRLRVELKVPDAFTKEKGPTVLLTAETLRHLEGLRIESNAEYIKQKTLLEKLETLGANELTQAISMSPVQDNLLNSYLVAQAIEEQKLVSLQKEFGPEHPEMVKQVSQVQALETKVKARTAGILNGLRAKVAAESEGMVALSNAVEQAQAADVQKAQATGPYFEAKRELEELVRFRAALQTKVAMERTDFELIKTPLVEIVEEAVAPVQPVSVRRSRAAALMGSGLLLAVGGVLLARLGRPGDGSGLCAAPSAAR